MAGRPSKYESHVEPKLLLIEAWARDGLTLEDIAKNLDIALSTFCEYKNQYTELAESLKKNKELADIIVENSLYKRANGYKYEEITYEAIEFKSGSGEDVTIQPATKIKTVIKEVVPDTTAQIFWLKNRKPVEWRDKHEIESRSEVVNKHEYHIEQTITSDPESAELLKQLYKRANHPPMGDPSKA